MIKAIRSDGTELLLGDKITDELGDEWVFIEVVEAGKYVSAMVPFTSWNCWFKPEHFGLKIKVEGKADETHN